MTLKGYVFFLHLMLFNCSVSNFIYFLHLIVVYPILFFTILINKIVVGSVQSLL